MDAGIAVFTDRPFDDAVEATRAALAAHGLGILHEIDLTATLAKKVGVEIERVLILGACDPEFSAKAFAVSKDVALMIPCNVVVRESDGGCVIEAQNPEVLSQIISGGLGDLAEDLATRLRSILAELAH